MPKADILILGGGIGGLVASITLKKKLKQKANVKLIERKSKFQFPPSYPWLMFGERKPEEVQKELGLLTKKGIDVVNDDITSINLEQKSVTAKQGTHSYDHLIVTLGAEYAPASIKGFDRAHHFYDLPSAIESGEAMRSFEGGTLAIGVARTPFKCPAAPYEAALLLEDYYRNRGIKEKVRFEFFTPEGMPLPSAPPEVGAGVVDLFKSRGISFHPKLKVIEIAEKEVLFESGERIPFDLLFCVPPHKAPQLVIDAGLTDQTGWIPVNPTTLETGREDVYALGDVAAVPTPSGYVPFLPKAGVFAHGQAEVVANNVAVRINGKGRAKEWDGHGACFLEVGGGKGAFLEGYFLAEPKPKLKFHNPSRKWHAEKVLFEKFWMHHWF